MLRFGKHIAIHLSQHGFLQLDFRADALNLVNRGIRGQRTLLGLAGDRLMQHIAEQIRPTDQTAGCVNDLVIENAVIVHGVGHERKYRNLAAIAGHERAEGQSVRGVRAAVGAGNGHITLVLRGEQVLHARHEIGEPADVLLQLRIGVVDHHRIKADARDNKERMAVIGGFIIEQRQSADIHQTRTMRCGDGQRRIDIIHRNAHIAGKQIAGANRDDAQRVTGSRKCARHRAHRAVAADRDHHVGAMLQGFQRAGATILIKLRSDIFNLREMLRLAELLNMLLALFRLWFRRIDHKRVMHLIIVALVELFRKFAMLIRAYCEKGGRAHRCDRKNDNQNDNRHRHVIYCSRKMRKKRIKTDLFDDSCTLYTKMRGLRRVSAFSTRLGGMLDIQFIREHADVVKESQRKRGESVELVDEVLRSDEVRRSSLKEFEAARAQQKEIGKKVAAAPADEKAKLIAETKELSQKVSEYKAAADAAAEEYTTAMWKLSNVVEPEAPEGGEDDYVVVKKVGQIRDFAAEGFEPKDHLTLGRGVAGIDMERGVKVGGSRFYFLRGQVARMQIAMLTMAVDQAEEHGFTLAITPTLVRPEVMRGTGFLNSHADEIYRLREPDEQYLVGTSEVALAGMHENEILDLSDGPLRYCGWSSCYRREAGAAGKDTSGIIRVHQFDKVEMFVYTKQEDSYKEHEHLLAMEQEMLGKVEVPYRIIDTAAGDLGSSAARKFDCEAWVPTQGRYRELTSTSNCTEYQARRLNIRERMEDGGTRAVSTLNGTLATTRWLVAILENHQQKDGSIVIPQAMRAYMGGKEVIEPTKWEA